MTRGYGFRLAPTGTHVWTDPACADHEKPRFGTRGLHRRNRGKRCETCRVAPTLSAAGGSFVVRLTDEQIEDAPGWPGLRERIAAEVARKVHDTPS